MLCTCFAHPLVSPPPFSVCIRTTPYLLNKMRLHGRKVPRREKPSSPRDLGRGTFELLLLGAAVSLYMGRVFLMSLCTHGEDRVDLLFNAQLFFLFGGEGSNMPICVWFSPSKWNSSKRVVHLFFCQVCTAFRRGGIVAEPGNLDQKRNYVSTGVYIQCTSA